MNRFPMFFLQAASLKFDNQNHYWRTLVLSFSMIHRGTRIYSIKLLSALSSLVERARDSKKGS